MSAGDGFAPGGGEGSKGGTGSAPNAGAASAGEGSSSPVIIERHEDRMIIRLNRPEVRNAIDQSMVDALHSVCAELEAEPKVAILTGTSGDRKSVV